jgi:TPR repeat protein
MKSVVKIAIAVVCLAVMSAAGPFIWHFVKATAEERKFTGEAKALRQRADQGDASAQYELARLYYQGKGLPQDYKQAADWYRKAADQGNPKGQYGIGFMYYYGKGVPQDYAAALGWYRKAAEQGYAKAQYDIGYSYYEGKEVSLDYSEAARWFRKGADQGNVKAQYVLALMYQEGKGLPQDCTQALDWWRKAADQGDSISQYALGYTYYEGKEVPQDYIEAVRWYRKAGDQGDVRAQSYLGYLYSNGKGVPRDYVESARWYRKAAKQGDQYAQRALDSMNIRITAGRKIYLSAALLGVMSLLISSKGKIGDQQQRGVTLGALLGALWVVLTVYGDSHVGLLYSLSAVNTFYFVRGLVSGASVVMLLCFVWPQGTKTVLSICGTFFIAFNVYAITHFHLRHIADCPRAFYSINALLMGAAITAFFLLLASRRAAGSRNGNAADSQLVTNH